MRSKKYLREIFDIEKSIQALKREREVIMASTFKIPRLTDMKVQSTPTTNIEDTFAEFAEYAGLITEKIDELVKLKMTISKQIDELDDIDEQSVLRYRYTIGLDWEKIFEIMHYSKAHTHRIHSMALVSFELKHKKFLDEYYDNETQ